MSRNGSRICKDEFVRCGVLANRKAPEYRSRRSRWFSANNERRQKTVLFCQLNCRCRDHSWETRAGLNGEPRYWTCHGPTADSVHIAATTEVCCIEWRRRLCHCNKIDQAEELHARAGMVHIIAIVWWCIMYKQGPAPRSKRGHVL